MNRGTLIFILVAGLAGGAGAFFGALLVVPAAPPELAAGTLLDQPRPLPEFRLVRHDEQAFTRVDFEGEWSLVFFGFTHCPDVCPNTLFLLDHVVEQLDDDAPQVLFVSVDTARDTPGQLAQYVDYFNPDFVGATGDGDNLLKLTRAMSVAYEFHPEGDSYTVIHSSTVLLVDPQARLRAIFTPPLHADAITTDLRRLFAAD